MHPRKDNYWGRFAGRYDRATEYVVGRDLREVLADELRREEPLQEVLECGCGSGYFTRILAERSSQVLATDLSGEMLEAAMIRLGRYNNVRLQEADCANLPFPDEHFDAVVMANVLHTLPNPLKALREAGRVVRWNGRVLVLSYTDFGMAPWEVFWMALRYYRMFGPPPPEGLILFTPSQLRGLLEEASLTVQEIRIIGSRTLALYGRAVRQRKGDRL
ncbi:MAG: class I SAM-dependent methyltransferase [Syntrophaceae bacterium]|nr:class I SAM-dependent methyltransferase [Syntrophaceae bacterium]